MLLDSGANLRKECGIAYAALGYTVLDIELIFKAESKALYDLLTGDRGFEIPSYQRPYSWDRTNVARLLEDVTAGMQELTANRSALRFIGSVITVRRMVGEDPRTRLIVIDGQQRLCTILVLNALLHDQLSAVSETLRARDDDRLDLLLEEADGLLEKLSNTFEFTARRLGDNYRLFPKIVRTDDDFWSRHANQARYDSPIARFLRAYIAYSNTPGQDDVFLYSALDANEQILEGHEALVGVIAALQDDIKNLADGTHSDFELPALPGLRADPDYVAELWDETPAPDDLELLLDEDADGALHRLVRLVALGKFVNFRTAATVVEATEEDYAFDMFEAMNTTGQPLTAFETFKPKITLAEGENYRGSPSQSAVKRIDRYLDRYSRADERQNVTSTLLIPFALLEDGKKLERHLSRQRGYLRERYANATTLASKREMVSSLADLAEFVQGVWQGQRKVIKLIPGVELTDDVAAFCLAALRDLNHEIVLAPIARFYSAYQSATGTQAKTAAAADYFGAIKAITAFSMIWRANYGGTSGVDSAYRELMAKGGGGVPPLSRNPAVGAGVAPSLENLKSYFRWKLGRKGIDRARWVATASSEVAYKSGQQALIRFLLLTASHDTVPDVGTPGFLEVGIRNVQPLMTPARWFDETTNSIEHIAPQSLDAAGWPADLYTEVRTVNRLGNLILIPQLENSAFADRPWAQKKILLTLFGSKTRAEVEAAMTAAQAGGFNPGKRVEELLADASFLSMCASIKDFNGQWNEDWVSRRSRHLVELAWDRLWPWLEAPPAPAAAAQGGLG